MKSFGVTQNIRTGGGFHSRAGVPLNTARTMLERGCTPKQIANVLGWTERKVRFLIVEIKRIERAKASAS